MPNHLDLTGPALELARSINSTATSVLQARQDANFRSKGLLPQFTAANQRLLPKQQVKFLSRSWLVTHLVTDFGRAHLDLQVRRFAIIPSIFTKKTGELKPDGSLNRLKIKKACKCVFAFMPAPIRSCPIISAFARASSAL